MSEVGAEETANSSDASTWQLRLYIAGHTVRSLRAIENLRRICEDRLAHGYSIEVIDLSEDPQRARTDDIIALPTVVRHAPQPMRQIIGDLSDTDAVLVGLDMVDFS